MKQRTKKLLAIVLVVCTICTLSSINVFASEPFSVIWLSQKYDKVFPFKDGIGTAHKDNKIIFFNKTGKEIAPPFDGIVINKYGLIQVTQDHIKYGLMDSKGKMITPMIYDGISELSEGLIRLMKDGKQGFMDLKGKIVIPLKYNVAMDFQEGLAPVGVKVKEGYGGDKWGFVDKTGKVVIPIKYKFARNFSEGLAWVAQGGDYDFRYGAIDKTGKVVIPFEYYSVNDFENGVAYVMKSGGYCYIDKRGKELPSDKEYLASLDFEDGLAKVFTHGGNYVYLDKTGKEIYPPSPDIRDFSEGLAAVRQGMKYGFIDRTGKVVIPCVYHSVSNFKEGFALVDTGEQLGFIDKTGNMAIPLSYARADDFNEGLARVRTGMHYGLIDQTGKEVVPLIYQNISSFKDGYAVVTNDDFRRGVINQKGEVVVPLIYNSISDFSEGVAYVTLGDKVGIILNPSSDFYDLPKEAQAVPSKSKVMVNDKEVAFDAYTINGSNFFKLRDLAYVLNGTEKQFNIVWDNGKKAINLATNSPYIAAGGEMGKGNGKAQTASLNTSSIYKNGQSVTLIAYNINGNNYFKLRDIGQAFDFSVAWDGSINTISIHTAKGYQE